MGGITFNSYQNILNAIIAGLNKCNRLGLTTVNNKKQTPLILAVQCGHTPLPALLGSKINAKDANGFSALYYALQIQNKNAAKVLLERGAEVTKPLDLENLLKLFHDIGKHPEFNQSVMNDILLHLINNVRQYSIFLETIVKHAKANDAIKDSLKHLVEGRTPIEYAIERNNMDAVHLLLQHASDLNQQYQIFDAIHCNDVCTMTKLIEESHIAELSPYIMLYAARYGHQKLRTVASALLKAQNQATAASAKQDSYKTLQRFIHQKDVHGQSALMFATAVGDIDNVKTLLNYGADANLQTQSGRSALMIACKQGNINLVKMLLDNGANVNLTDNKNQSCLDHIVGHHTWREDLFQLLVENPGCSEYRKKRAIRSTLQHKKLNALSFLLMAGAEIEYFTIAESQMDERGVYGNVSMNPLEVLIHIIHTRILMSSLFLDAGTDSTLAYTALYELDR